MKDIKELSILLGCSKESIYKKIKSNLQNELQNHVYKVKGKTFIDEEGEKLILQSLRKDNISESINLNDTDITDDFVITKDITKLQDEKLQNSLDIIEKLNVRITELEAKLKDNEIELVKVNAILSEKENMILKLEQDIKESKLELQIANETIRNGLYSLQKQNEELIKLTLNVGNDATEITRNNQIIMAQNNIDKENEIKVVEPIKKNVFSFLFKR